MKEKLTKKYITKFLYDLPEEIDMKRIRKPLVTIQQWRTGENLIHGIVGLMESHAFAYAWPDRREAYVGICSCKPFDYETTAKLIANKFGAERCKK